MNLADLSKEFPRDAIHWRAQTLTRSGDKALALAYLDARDVMDRLDEVCRPENWQDSYSETPKGRIIGRIGIKVGDKWVWKSDGAGDTAVEGEKGGISDALKRAAVKWGIGRYLYRLDAVWAPCETYEKNGKKYWSKWKGSPWDSVRSGPPAREPEPTPPELRGRLKGAIEKQTIAAVLKKMWAQDSFSQALNSLPEPMQNELTKAYSDKLDALLPDDPALQAPDMAAE